MSQDSVPDTTVDTRLIPPLTISPMALFWAFSRMALLGFGGVMPVAYQTLVDRLRWVSNTEFAELLALGQVLPGPTICNLSLMIGYRRAGLAGALAALSGMLVLPIAIVLSLMMLYQRFGEIPSLHRALIGMSAVASGLILATALKMAVALFKPTSKTPTALLLSVFVMLAFVGVGILRWPLILVVGMLSPITVGLAYWKNKS